MTKSLKHSKTINLTMYNCKVYFIITDALETVAAGIYKKYKIEKDFEGESEGMLISPDLTDYYLIIDLKYLTHNTIAHELTHCVIRVTEDRGISDEETQAWLAGHLTELLYKFVEKKNLVVKHG